MGKTPMLVIDREVIDFPDTLAVEYAKDKILEDWIVAIIDDGNLNPLRTAISQMQIAMIQLGLENNGLVCNDRQGLTCWHVHSTESQPKRVRDVAHPLHENANCKSLLGKFCKPHSGILQHLVQHFALQKIPLECLIFKTKGIYLLTHQGCVVTLEEVLLSEDKEISVEKELLNLQSSDFRNDTYLWGQIGKSLS